MHDKIILKTYFNSSMENIFIQSDKFFDYSTKYRGEKKTSTLPDSNYFYTVE